MTTTIPTSPITPMKLGDIFDRLFKLIGKTWVRNLALASLILFLPTMIMIVGMDSFFSSIAETAETGVMGNQAAPEELARMFGSMGLFFVALFVFMLGTIAATLAVTVVGCEEMNGRFITWQEALAQSFGIRLLRLLGQYLLEMLIFVGLIMIPYLLIFVAIAVDVILLGLFAGLALFASILFVVYLAIKWAFAVPAIGSEDAGVMQAFKRSWDLVEGNWWRACGILLLMSVIVSFAVSLVMTPVYLIALWGFFAAYFDLLGSIGSGEPDPSTFLEMFKSVGFGFGIVTGLSTLLQLLVSPLYTVVLYFDLRARKGEFHQPTPPAEIASL